MTPRRRSRIRRRRAARARAARRPTTETTKLVFGRRLLDVEAVAEELYRIDCGYVGAAIDEYLDPLAVGLGFLDETTADGRWRRMHEAFRWNDDDGTPV